VGRGEKKIAGAPPRNDPESAPPQQVPGIKPGEEIENSRTKNKGFRQALPSQRIVVRITQSWHSENPR
jgi:hypothetical protein